MDQLNQERRGLFDGLRVPFDLNMLVLAIACVAGFLLFMWLTHLATGDPIITGGVPPIVAFFMGQDVGWRVITYVLVVAISLAFWTFFSTAICRIAAMKLAREETLSLKDACTFAARKFAPVLWSVLLVAAILFGTYAFLNATIFGWIGRIPWVGEIIVSLLFFLPLLFTFFFTFALVLGLFGFNLAASAIATESSDTWDGISRSWNYILVRPWQVLLVYGLTAAYLAVFLVFATKFLDWSVDSLAVGWWGMGENPRLVEVETEDLPQNQRALAGDEKRVAVVLPGKETFLERYVDGQYESGDGSTVVMYPPELGFGPEGRAEREKIRELVKSKEGKMTVINADRSIDVTDMLPASLFFGGFLIWLWLWLCKLAIYGYALQYFFGATTTLYFLLRKDVEGEEYSEIVVEEEELADEAAWEVKEPAKPGAPGVPPAPGAAAPAGGLIMPKPASPSASAGGAGAPAGPGAAPPAPPPAPSPAGAPAPAAPGVEGEKK